MRFIRLKGFWILGAVLSALHLGFTFYCIMASFGSSMSRFDHPEMPPDRAGRIFSATLPGGDFH